MARKDDIGALTTRLRNCAQMEKVTVKEFVTWPRSRLMRVPNMGRKTVDLAQAIARSEVGALWFWADGSGGQ